MLQRACELAYGQGITALAELAGPAARLTRLADVCLADLTETTHDQRPALSGVDGVRNAVQRAAFGAPVRQVSRVARPSGPCTRVRGHLPLTTSPGLYRVVATSLGATPAALP
jgi:hypothetical protein